MHHARIGCPHPEAKANTHTHTHTHTRYTRPFLCKLVVHSPDPRQISHETACTACQSEHAPTPLSPISSEDKCLSNWLCIAVHAVVSTPLPYEAHLLVFYRIAPSTPLGLDSILRIASSSRWVYISRGFRKIPTVIAFLVMHNVMQRPCAILHRCVECPRVSHAIQRVREFLDNPVFQSIQLQNRNHLSKCNVG